MSLRFVYDEQFANVATDLICRANEEIYITTYKLEYITNKRSPRLAGLLRALVSAAERKVAVRFLINGSDAVGGVRSANYHAARLLARNHIEVRTPSLHQTLHAKILLADRSGVIVGSHNWTRGSVDRNSELSVLIESSPLVPEIRDRLFQIWESAAPF